MSLQHLGSALDVPVRREALELLVLVPRDIVRPCHRGATGRWAAALRGPIPFYPSRQV